MKKSSIFIVGILIGTLITIVLGLYVRCQYASSSIRSVGPHYFIKELKGNIKFIDFRLRKGLSKSAVEKIVGQPFNSDNQNVWFWPVDYFEFTSNNPHMLWRKHPDGLYVLFDEEGKLAFSGFRETETQPIYDCGPDNEFSHLIGPYSDLDKMMDDKMKEWEREETQKRGQ
ncbi:MAG: hypothetical protein MUC65_00700 [Pontiellaceae bacterium]|jgi:hypothetical protein|nr:hypothetical protein [Pontiellaceae bacterium]